MVSLVSLPMLRLPSFSIPRSCCSFANCATTCVSNKFILRACSVIKTYLFRFYILCVWFWLVGSIVSRSVDVILVRVTLPVFCFWYQLMFATNCDMFWQNAFEHILFDFVVDLSVQTMNARFFCGYRLIMLMLILFSLEGNVQYTFNNIHGSLLMRNSQCINVQRRPNKIEQKVHKRVSVFLLFNCPNCNLDFSKLFNMSTLIVVNVLIRQYIHDLNPHFATCGNYYFLTHCFFVVDPFQHCFQFALGCAPCAVFFHVLQRIFSFVVEAVIPPDGGWFLQNKSTTNTTQDESKRPTTPHHIICCWRCGHLYACVSNRSARRIVNTQRCKSRIAKQVIHSSTSHSHYIEPCVFRITAGNAATCMHVSTTAPSMEDTRHSTLQEPHYCAVES